MYPASRLAQPVPPSPVHPKLLSLAAGVVLLVAAWVVLVGLKPEPSYLVAGGHPVPSCATHFGMAPRPGDPGYERYVSDLCHTVVPNQHVPERIGVAAAAIVLVGGLTLAAARTARERPVFG
jgi:hypothetical protein